jgi:hypothetical protein
MAHIYTNLLTHIIFSTKDRKPTLELDLKGRREIPVGMNEGIRKGFLSPLPGLGLFLPYCFYPRLTPWATICRRYAANATPSIVK